MTVDEALNLRDDLKRDVRLCVADVGFIVRSDSANEHRHATAMEGDELLLAPGERVVDAESHRSERIGGPVLRFPNRCRPWTLFPHCGVDVCIGGAKVQSRRRAETPSPMNPSRASSRR